MITNLFNHPYMLLLLQEVPMIPQPSYAQAGSVYYICLLRDDLLLHQGKETIGTSSHELANGWKGLASVLLDQFRSHFYTISENLVSAGFQQSSFSSYCSDVQVYFRTT